MASSTRTVRTDGSCRRWPRISAAIVAGVMAALVVGTGVSGAASAPSTISVTVASATNIDASACTSGTANVTDMGTVLPNQSSVTSLDCNITFGSSNDTSMLRVSQTDALGVAMYSPSIGELDTAFDTDGKQTTGIGAGAAGDNGNAVAVQPDGKILLAGSCNMGATTMDFCIARYGANGALDTSFDTDGKQTTPFGAGVDYGNSVALQQDGKIVVAGSCTMGGTGSDLCLARYTSAGALDTTFDTDGMQTTAIGSGAATDAGGYIALQPDGKILLVGSCDMGGATSFDICVVRYTTSGALDTTFDTDGKQTTPVGAGANSDYGDGITMQPDGKIVVAGNCDMGGTGADFCVVRYTSAGALDTTFDADGMQTTPIGAGAAYDDGSSIALQPDGKIAVGGTCNMGATGPDLCIARYTSAGALDATFDTDGKQTTPVGAGAATDQGNAMTLQADGRFLVTGLCSMGATGYDLCTARYTTSGALDSTFDTDGKVTTDIDGSNNDDFATSIALQPDGELIVGGTCDTTTSTDFCLASYSALGTFSQYLNGTTGWGSPNTTHMFGACLASVGGGASAQWTTNATCPASDGAYWNPIPTAATKIAYTTSAGTAAATAQLRFGLRTSISQPAGSYLAPLAFDVAAPNV